MSVSIRMHSMYRHTPVKRYDGRTLKQTNDSASVASLRPSLPRNAHPPKHRNTTNQSRFSSVTNYVINGVTMQRIKAARSETNCAKRLRKNRSGATSGDTIHGVLQMASALPGVSAVE